MFFGYWGVSWRWVMKIRLFRASIQLLSPALRQLNHLFTSHVGPMCVMRENGNTEEGFWHFGYSCNCCSGDYVSWTNSGR